MISLWAGSRCIVHCSSSPLCFTRRFYEYVNVNYLETKILLIDWLENPTDEFYFSFSCWSFGKQGLVSIVEVELFDSILCQSIRIREPCKVMLLYFVLFCDCLSLVIVGCFVCMDWIFVNCRRRWTFDCCRRMLFIYSIWFPWCVY